MGRSLNCNILFEKYFNMNELKMILKPTHDGERLSVCNVCGLWRWGETRDQGAKEGGVG